MSDSPLSPLSEAMNQKYVQLSIWDLLEEAKKEPLEADFDLLWDGLDVSLVDLEVSQQLQVAAEVLLQMVEVFRVRSTEAFEELEIYRSNDGAMMGDRDFAPFVRQTMEIDFDEFVEPLVSNIRKSYTTAEGDDNQSIVEIVDRELLLETIEESLESSLQQKTASVIEITHSENVSDWVEAIANYFTMTGIKKATWSELLDNLYIAPVEIFLGLLLGDFALNQNQSELSSFYDREFIAFIKC